MIQQKRAQFPSKASSSRSLLERPARFTANRRRAIRLFKILKRSLVLPRTAGAVQEIRDRLYFQIQRNRSDPALGSAIALSGATGQEGVTTVSLLLALSFAELEHSNVLVIDGRFHPPTFMLLREIFGLKKRDHAGKNGFSQLQHFSSRSRNLCFLGAETGVEAVEQYSHPGFGGFLGELKRSFRLIIFDMPPLLRHSETRLLAPLVDHFYLVCAPRRTRFADVEQTSSLIGDIGGTISGVIMNRQKVPFWTRWTGRDSFR